MKAVLDVIRRWRKETVSRRQLARFDDRLLADLGIARGDIPRVVRRLK